jgi:putative Mg2+ transporter-C (MgtC) family protein
VNAELQLFGSVLLAGGLGALIGLEREFNGKPAGLRTHIFVCAGSALLMLLGGAVMESFQDQAGETIQSDPIRVMQAIVIGISFLGAGTIVHQGGNQVEGLTTAASIYLTAGIGVAVAIDYLILALSTSVFAIAVLWGIGWIEYRIGVRRRSRSHRIRRQEPSQDEAADAAKQSGQGS